MDAQDSVRTLRPALQATQAFMNATGCPGIIIGGLAVCLVARPRTTKDVDAALLADTADLDALLLAAAQNDLKPRPEHDARFAVLQRILLLVHEPSQVPVDISLAALPFEEEAAQRASQVDLGGFSVRLPTPEDLVIMKALAHRPMDMVDIDTIVKIHPDLDRKRVERWVRDFADTLEMPELWDDLVPLLKAP